MTVRWIAPAAAEGATVDCGEFGKSGGDPVSRHQTNALSDDELADLSAELTGLTPGTEYQFQINKKGFTHRFRTMPAKATDSFQFVSGGDCDVNQHAIANNILSRQTRPDVRPSSAATCRL